MNAIFFKLFWYKVFVLRELQLLDFLVDSVLISTYFLTWDTTFYQSTDQIKGGSFSYYMPNLSYTKLVKSDQAKGCVLVSILKKSTRATFMQIRC